MAALTYNFKRTLSSVSEELFPGVTLCASNGFKKIGNEEVSSSLSLQMALYFNVIFCPVWLCTSFLLLYLKYDQLSMLYRLINVTVLVLVSFIECLRLYLGYIGNLGEKIPELAGFWMISFLIQLPLQLMLLFNGVTQPRPVETIFQSIMCTMLAIQIYTGFTAIRVSAKHHANTFRIRQAHM